MHKYWFYFRDLKGKPREVGTSDRHERGDPRATIARFHSSSFPTFLPPPPPAVGDDDWRDFLSESMNYRSVLSCYLITPPATFFSGLHKEITRSWLKSAALRYIRRQGGRWRYFWLHESSHSFEIIVSPRPWAIRAMASRRHSLLFTIITLREARVGVMKGKQQPKISWIAPRGEKHSVGISQADWEFIESRKRLEANCWER